jgi:hypothetical protein
MPSSADSVTFGGNPSDIDRLAASAQFQFILNADDFSSDPEQIAYFLSKCHGAALTWASRYLDQNPGLTAEPYAQFLLRVKESFGYDTRQSAAIARAQLSDLRHTGTLVEFFADFDDACGRADIQADEPKIVMVMDKLKPRYRNIIIETGTIPERYAAVRKKLLNISAMEGQAVHTELVQGSSRGRRSRKGTEKGAAGPRIKIEAKN